MKKLFLFLTLFVVKFAAAQDSLAISDTKALGLLLTDSLRLDRNEVKNYDTELFYVLIKIKDSAFSGMELLAKQNAGNKKLLENRLPSILRNFRSISGKDITIIYPLLIMNSLRPTSDYDFVRKLRDYSNGSSIYSSGLIILVTPDRRNLHKTESTITPSNY